MILGSTIMLRAVERKDLEQFRQWRNLPLLRKAFREYREISEWMQEEYWESVQGDPTQVHFAIAKHDDTLIGHCALLKISLPYRTAEFSIYVAPAYRGHGFGRDAVLTLIGYGFNDLNLHRIWSEVYAFNDKALALYISLGFTEEGRLRKHVYKDGEYHDSVMIGLLREDETCP